MLLLTLAGHPINVTLELQSLDAGGGSGIGPSTPLPGGFLPVSLHFVITALKPPSGSGYGRTLGTRRVYVRMTGHRGLLLKTAGVTCSAQTRRELLLQCKHLKKTACAR